MTVHQPLHPGKYRVQVDDYLLLAEEGSFGDARTELMDGNIRVMSPAYTRHSKAQTRLGFALQAALAAGHSGLQLFTAPSVRLNDETMPEPDLAVAADHDDGPLPIDKIWLIVEIADATPATDLNRKAGLCAAAGVPEYWVADVNGRVLHQMWSPVEDAYMERRDIAFGKALTAATLPELTTATETL